MHSDKDGLAGMLLEGLVQARRSPLERLLGLRRVPTPQEKRIASGIADVVRRDAPEDLLASLREAGVPVSGGRRLRELLSKDRMTSSEESELERLTSGREVILLEE